MAENQPSTSEIVNDSVNNPETSSKKDTSGADEIDITAFCDASVLDSFDFEPFEIDGTRLRSDRNHFGFDNNCGLNYIYPTNLPKRDYQYNIVKQALFKNTLVVLPTGLGKTFIAAVVMYNFFRWYPQGKIIFMAPTRPLVAQQVEACYNIMGIPKEDTAEMTGQRMKKFRKDIWHSKRVFFATPQLVQSDILCPEIEFPFADVKLLVVDEAHKAQGKYAYTEVVNTINSRNQSFRVLALSATPGRQIEDVAHVVRNLLISHIEVRTENSIDVSPYTHKKFIKTEVIPLGPRLTQIKNEFLQLMDPYVQFLLDHQACSGTLNTLSKGWLIMEQKKFREATLLNRHPQQSTVMEYFSTCVSLYHALECLERHGWRVFINYFEEETGTEKYYVNKDNKLKEFLQRLRLELGPNPFAVNDSAMLNGSMVQVIPKDLDFGHPKYEILRMRLCEYFKKNQETRVIVFCEYRESVNLVYRLLLQHRPLIRAKVFVGKGNSSLGLRALSQKEQMLIMKEFRAGDTCNTLIGTCVIEEGIDVCDVDLIVTFDISSKNPTRFVQRMGRTGRKRKGNILLLATEGKEHKVVKDVLASRDKTNQKLAKSKEIERVLYKRALRLVPPEFNPECLETYIKVEDNPVLVEEKKKKAAGNRKKDMATTSRAVPEGDEEDPTGTEEAAKKAATKKRTKKAPAGVQDVRNFFKKQIVIAIDPEDIFLPPSQEPPAFQDVLVTNKSFQGQTIDEQWKKLKNIHTNFEKDSSIAITKVPSISSLLNNSDLSGNVKKQVLFRNLEFVRDRLEAGMALEAFQSNKDSDCAILENGVADVRRDVTIIKEVLTDLVLDQFLNKQTILLKKKSDLISKLRQPLKDRTNETTIQTLKSSFVEINNVMKKYDKPKITPTVPVEVEEPVLAQTELDDSLMSVDLNMAVEVKLPAVVEEKLALQTQNHLPEFIKSESRYSDQFQTQANKFKTPERPPPLAPWKKSSSPLTTSTPKIGGNLKFKTPSPKLTSPSTSRQVFVKSPLLEAFKRLEQRQSPKLNINPVTTEPLPQKSHEIFAVEKYFKLDSLYDIFTHGDTHTRTMSLSMSSEKMEFSNANNIQISSLSSTTTSTLATSVPPVDLTVGSAVGADDVGVNSNNKKNNSIDRKSDNRKDDSNDVICVGKDNKIEKYESAIGREPMIARSHESNYVESTVYAEQNDDDVTGNSYSAATEELAVSAKILESVRQAVDDDDKSNINETSHTININAADNYVDFLMKKSLIMSSQTLNSNDTKDSNGNRENGIDVNDVVDNESDDLNASGYTISQIMERMASSVVSVSQKKIVLGDIDDIFAGSDDDLFAEPISSFENTAKVDAKSPKAKMPVIVSEIIKSPSIFRFRVQQQVIVTTSNSLLDDTMAIAPRNLQKRRIIYSDSSDNDEVDLMTEDLPDNDDIALLTCPTSKNSSQTPSTSRTSKASKKLRLKKPPSFVLSQAVVSDGDDEDDDETAGFIDGLIASEDDSDIEDHNNTEMRAKYLQSIRSPPVQRNGGFKIPDRPRLPPITANIFSQIVQPDNSTYKDDSFVVDEEDDDCIGRSSNEESLDELDRAEMILKNRRRKTKRKRRILRQDNQSSDEDQELEVALKKSKVEF